MTAVKKYFITLIKSFIIGASMSIPGVSGGTMAILLGTYDELIASVNSVAKLKFKKLLFLVVFAVGGLLGFVLLADRIEWLKNMYEKPVLFFFIGAVLGGVPLLIKKSEVKAFSWRVIVYPVLGIVVLWLITLLPSGLFQPDLSSGFSAYLVLFLAGVLLSVPLVLPGISFSLMLVVLGLYNPLINSLKTFDLRFFIPLGIGLVLGILVTTNLLEKAMKRFPQETYLIILGFVLASLADLFPGIPSGVEIPICLVLMLASAVGVFFLSKLDN